MGIRNCAKDRDLMLMNVANKAQNVQHADVNQ